MNIYKENLKKNEIIADQDYSDYLLYTGKENGHIWEFAQCELTEDGYLEVDEDNIRYLTPMELTDYKKVN